MSKKKKSNKGKGSRHHFYTKEDAFISRMASILMMPKREVRSIFSQRAITTLRVNNLASNPSDIEAKLLMKGVFLEDIPWAPYTFVSPNKDKSELAQFPEYEKGLYYFQNLSSILSVLVLDPQKEEKILDACASPGSKTSYIASITENKAKIVAEDDDGRRLSKLKNVLAQFHVKNVTVRKGDARYIGKGFPNHFDKILLDVPCSSEGLIYLRGEKPLRSWSIKKVKRMASMQKEMIISSFDALKKDGRMVYSTCTLEPEENEGVITHLLQNREDARIEKIALVDQPIFECCKDLIKPGITKWSGMKFHQECAKAIRVIPGAKMEGFFIAYISKK